MQLTRRAALAAGALTLARCGHDARLTTPTPSPPTSPAAEPSPSGPPPEMMTIIDQYVIRRPS